jgi:hemerythrin-like domain-containing protein
MLCLEIIIQDHTTLRRSVSVLDGMVKMMEEGARIEIADVAALLTFLRRFGDEYHQRMEEQVLFPALLSGVPVESPLRAMLSEHVEERTLVSRIEDALRFKMGKEFVSSSHQLSLLLRNHFDKEDAVLGDVAEKCLSKEQDEAVAAELIKHQPPAEAHPNFSRLEWKYTSKPPNTPLTPQREAARAYRSATTR